MNTYSRGVTLVELMIAVVVLGILAALAAPGLSNLLSDTARTTNTNDFLVGLQVARSEAIKRSARVTICPPDALNTQCAGSQWENGFIVFDDANGELTISAGESLIRAHEGFSGADTTIRSPDASIQAYVSFVANGFPQMVDGTPQSGNFRICDQGGAAEGRGISLLASGRISSYKPVAACP